MSEKMKKRLKEYNKKKKLSLKDERRERNKVKGLRRIWRRQQALRAERIEGAVDEMLERRRIIREVEEGA